MKKFLALLGGACFLGVGVLTVDAAPPQPVSYSWTGFYFGGNIGADRASLNSDPFGFSTGAFTPDTGFGGTLSAAIVGGGQVGYNWQFNRLVLGLEADIQDTSHSQTIAFLGGFQCGAIGCGATPGIATAKTDVEGSIRARVGWAFDRWLVYGTAGFATADVRVNSSGPTTVPVLAAFPANTTSNHEVLDGWTVGAGVEYAVTNAVSVGVQYRYTDFGQTQFPVFAGATPLGTNNFVNVGVKESQVTARLNVKLDGLPGFAGASSVTPSFLPSKAPPAVAYNWTGFYVGANFGGDWGSFNSDPFGFTATPVPLAALPLLFTGSPNVGLSGSASPGVIGGGQLGYNWQLGRFVVGWEGDVQGTSLQRSVTSLMFPNCSAVGLGVFGCNTTPGNVTAREIVQGSVRLRLGYAFDRWLVYGTVGWATADMQINSAAAGTPPAFFNTTSSNNEILNGWTLGAGFVYALTDTISLGAEYRHTDFGQAQFPVVAGGTTGGFVAVPVRGLIGAFSTGGNAINAGLVEDQVTAKVNVKLGSLFGPATVTW